MNVTAAELEVALNAAILSLNAANDACSYAESAMRKATEGKARAAASVKALEALIQRVDAAERAAK